MNKRRRRRHLIGEDPREGGMEWVAAIAVFGVTVFLEWSFLNVPYVVRLALVEWERCCCSFDASHSAGRV